MSTRAIKLTTYNPAFKANQTRLIPVGFFTPFNLTSFKSAREDLTESCLRLLYLPAVNIGFSATFFLNAVQHSVMSIYYLTNNQLEDAKEAFDVAKNDAFIAGPAFLLYTIFDSILEILIVCTRLLSTIYGCFTAFTCQLTEHHFEQNERSSVMPHQH